MHLICVSHVQIPMAEVQVNWTEIPGSKVRLSSVLHMALELLMIKAGYQGGCLKPATRATVLAQFDGFDDVRRRVMDSEELMFRTRLKHMHRYQWSALVKCFTPHVAFTVVCVCVKRWDVLKLRPMAQPCDVL